MAGSPLDPFEANRRLLADTVGARARFALPVVPQVSPTVKNIVGVAGMPDLVKLPRFVDIIGRGAASPPWASVAASTAAEMVLQAQRDQVRAFMPAVSALASTQHLMSPAFGAIRAQQQSALAVGPLITGLPRFTAGLDDIRSERISRGLLDLTERPGVRLGDDEADELVALLERDDAAEQLATLGTMCDVVADIVDSEPVAELLDHLDPDQLATVEHDDRAELEQEASATLGQLRGRLHAFSAWDVTTLVAASTSVVTTTTLDLVGVDISLGLHISIPLGIITLSSYVRDLNDAARKRQTDSDQQRAED